MSAVVDPAVLELDVPTRSEVTRVNAWPEGLETLTVRKDVPPIAILLRVCFAYTYVYSSQTSPLLLYYDILYLVWSEKSVLTSFRRKERIRLGSLSRKLKRFNDKYTFFDADFVFYIPWPKSYFVKIISKRINYFEWYSLLFFYPKFYPNVHII